MSSYSLRYFATWILAILLIVAVVFVLQFQYQFTSTEWLSYGLAIVWGAVLGPITFVYCLMDITGQFVVNEQARTLSVLLLGLPFIYALYGIIATVMARMGATRSRILDVIIGFHVITTILGLLMVKIFEVTIRYWG